MSILSYNQDLTSKDFDSLRQRLIALVQTVFPDWSDFEIANFGNLLIEMYAFVGDVLRDASAFGARPFDMSLEVLVRGKKITREVAIGEAVVPKQLELRLLDITKGAS